MFDDVLRPPIFSFKTTMREMKAILKQMLYLRFISNIHHIRVDFAFCCFYVCVFIASDVLAVRCGVFSYLSSLMSCCCVDGSCLVLRLPRWDEKAGCFGFDVLYIFIICHIVIIFFLVSLVSYIL